MTMAAKGVAKLIEECGELQQVLGKKLAMWDQDEHWDGTNLRERMQDEMGDVYAAIEFVTFWLGLDHEAIARRMREKRDLYDDWQKQIDNNDHGIDRYIETQLAELRTHHDIWEQLARKGADMCEKLRSERDALQAQLDAPAGSGSVPSQDATPAEPMPLVYDHQPMRQPGCNICVCGDPVDWHYGKDEPDGVARSGGEETPAERPELLPVQGLAEALREIRRAARSSDGESER